MYRRFEEEVGKNLIEKRLLFGRYCKRGIAFSALTVLIFLSLTTPVFAQAVATYESDYSTPKATYAIGETVYAKATGLTSGNDYDFYYNTYPEPGTEQGKNRKVRADASGECRSSYTLKVHPPDPTGNWFVRVVNWKAGNTPPGLCHANFTVTGAQVVVVDTYGSDYSTPKDSYALLETVYANATGLTSGNYYDFYYNSAGTERGFEKNVGEAGSGYWHSSYPLKDTDPTGSWQVRVVNQGAHNNQHDELCVADFSVTGAQVVDTYESDYSTPKDSYALLETVYANATGLTSGNYYDFYYNSAGTEKGFEKNVGEAGSGYWHSSYPLKDTDPTGSWQVRVVNQGAHNNQHDELCVADFSVTGAKVVDTYESDYSTPKDSYALLETVYANATGLTSGNYYDFYYNSAGTEKGFEKNVGEVGSGYWHSSYPLKDTDPTGSWQVRVVNQGAHNNQHDELCVADFSVTGAKVVDTYESDYSTPKDSYALLETVYANATGLTSGNYYDFYYNSAGKEKGSDLNVGEVGSGYWHSSYPLKDNDPTGGWQVRVVNQGAHNNQHDELCVADFSVTGVPEFPSIFALGAGMMFLICGAIYLVMRKHAVRKV